MNFDLDTITEKIKHIGIPLYCSIFGFRLYGTNDENSDIDYKGIYLP